MFERGRNRFQFQFPLQIYRTPKKKTCERLQPADTQKHNTDTKELNMSHQIFHHADSCSLADMYHIAILNLLGGNYSVGNG